MWPATQMLNSHERRVAVRINRFLSVTDRFWEGQFLVY